MERALCSPEAAVSKEGNGIRLIQKRVFLEPYLFGKLIQHPRICVDLIFTPMEDKNNR